jgi:uncharacterized MAPEG superfamily protein
MPIAFWCILAVLALTYLPIALTKGKRAASGYDNARPRETEARFTGLNARAYGAHQNGLEAFPLFAAAVLTATVLHAAGPTLDRLAVLYVVLRLAYVAAYLGNLATPRSAIWFFGFVTAIAIFTLPAWR